MRQRLLLLLCFGLSVQTSIGDLHAPILRRQATTSGLPSLTTTLNTPLTSATSSGSSASLTAASSLTSNAATASSTAALSSSSPSSSSSRASPSTSASSKSKHVSTSSTATSSSSVASNPTSTAEPNNNQPLPLQPHITPALSITGVILILTGVTYTLIGVKNRWIQTFLSTAYLVSVSVLVLIDYVMHPPVSDSVQGAYFVAIFMTGCIFGGGSLIFMEVTEGLGCLLGGFSLGMWFLTLKAGGVVSGSAGVGILLAIFCVVGWALSFSKHTRDYALIGSTSFSGATAFTLGIDCFSRAGYKEFWLYIWNLNSDLFPLYTNNYPLTRGIRVEIAVIVIGTIVGVISQVKLWKVIRNRRKAKEAIHLEEENRKEAVDEALGRHLQRQNEMAKQQWERVYGSGVGAKRPTSMVDSVIDPEDQSRRGSRVSIIRTRMHSGLGPHSQVVEMRPVLQRQPSSNPKRPSTMSADAIAEQNEEHEYLPPHNKSTTDLSARSLDSDLEAQSGLQGKLEDTFGASEPSLTEGPTYPNTATEASSAGTAEPESTLKAGKRRSFQGFLQRLSSHYANPGSGPPSPALQNTSQEGLVAQEMAHHSRASSVAATLDEDHDRPDANRLSVFYGEAAKPPVIVVSPALHSKDETKRRSFLEAPPSPPALSTEFDPEELARPLAPETNLGKKKSKPELTSASQAQPQTSERIGPSSDASAVDGLKTTLTTGALAAVPSQLSNVVLSYRTNEWAKHATTADVPIIEESHSNSGDDNEPSIQVLNTVTGMKAEPQNPMEKLPEKGTWVDPLPPIDRRLSATSKPPKPHVVAQQEDTVRSNNSGGSPMDSGSLQKDHVKQNQSTGDPFRTTPKIRPTLSAGQGLRSSSTPTLGQSLVTSPIEEDMEMFFPQSGQVSTTPSSAGAAILNAQRQNLLRNQSIQRSQSQQDLPRQGSSMRPNSSGNQRLQHSMSRPTSRTGTSTEIIPIPSLAQIARPSTRLNSYDSRQPVRQSTAPNPQQRESMLADWRTSMQQDAGRAEDPEQTMAQRRAEMLAQKAILRRSESQQSFMQATREGAMDQLMRRSDMQDAHRAALRKMQARVNETGK